MNIITKTRFWHQLKTTDFEKIFEFICMTYIFLYCFSKTDIFDLDNKLDNIINIVFVIAVCRVCCLVIKNGFNKYLFVDIACLLLYIRIISFCSSRVSLYANSFYVNFVLCVCVLGIGYNRVLHSVSLGYMMAILYGFIASLTNIMDFAAREYTRTYGDTTYHIIRSGWGCGHENTLGIRCFLAASCFCLGFKKLSKVLRSLVAFLVAAFVWIIPNSRFNAYLLILLGIVLFIDYLHEVFLQKKYIFHIARKFAEFVALILTCVTPFLIIYVTLHYEKLNPAFLQKLDAIASGRIWLGYNAYKESGFSLWGQYDSGAFYIDSGWIRLPVLLGIPLTLFVIAMLLYVEIKAFATDDFLLICLITLVSVSGICYELVAMGDNNIFLLLPFASYAKENVFPLHISANHVSEYRVKKIKHFVYTNAGLISVFIISALLIIFRKPLISILQTQIECSNYAYPSRTLLILMCILVPVIIVIGLSECIRLWVGEKQFVLVKERHFWILIASCLVFIGIQLYGYCYVNALDENSSAYEEVLADEDAMRILETIQDVDVVPQIKPYLYRKYYGFTDLKWMPTADYARFDNITVILDVRDNYRTLSHTEFLQTPISDYHKVYTNDSRVIEAMEEAGYSFTNYSQYVKELDLVQYAELNDLKQEKDGSIIVKASEDGQVITKKAAEDFVEIFNDELVIIDEDGNYNLHIVLEANADTLSGMNGEDGVAHIVVSFSQGTFLDYTITVDDFTNGVATCDVPFSMSHVGSMRYNTQFTIDEAYTLDFSIKEISYYRTE